MMLFAHHIGVELLGREFSPHGVFQHVCTFAAVSFFLATSAYGCWTLFQKVLEAARVRREG
jgi:hypothetical protein